MIDYYEKQLSKLPQHALSNTEIDEIMATHKNIDYRGTYPSDLTPKLKDNQYCIINNDVSTGNGIHWVALAKSLKDVYIYDSYGRDHSLYLPDFLAKRYINWTKTDDKPEQKILLGNGELEVNCGARSISWILTCNRFGIRITSEFI